MKTSITILMAALTLSVTSCKEREVKKSEDIIVHKLEKPKLSPPIRMEKIEAQRKVFTLQGNSMTSEISRTPDDSLGYVKDIFGQEFVDNRVMLKVTYNGKAKTVINRSFTKNDFKKHLSEEYINEGVLDGIAFDRTNKDTIFFGVNIALPQTDEFTPLILALTKDGRYTVSVDIQMDTAGEEMEMTE